MKKTLIFTILMMIVVNLVFISAVFAQSTPAATPVKSSVLETVAIVIFGSGLVQEFKNGGFFMWPILFVLLYTLSYIIWKFVTLVYGKIRLDTLLDKIIPLIKSKKYKEAAEICAKTRGPVAAIIYAGLLKADKGVEAFEKAVENAAMIEMSFLEKGFTEMSAGITLAPMLGFLGTVDGMIVAFQAIAAARAVDATIVANGIQIALITTKWGLMVAIPTQFFNNIFVTQVDGMVIDMQRATEKVTETMVEA